MTPTLLSLQAVASALLLVGRRGASGPQPLTRRPSAAGAAGAEQAQEQLRRLEDVGRLVATIVLQLLPLRSFPHRARIRMGQCLACALLEQTHSFQLEAKQPQAPGSIAGSSETLLTKFRAAHLTVSVTTMLRSAPKSKAAFKVATIALSRFFRYAAVLYPQVAMYVLAELALCWLEVYHDEECGYFIESHLVSKTRL